MCWGSHSRRAKTRTGPLKLRPISRFLPQPQNRARQHIATRVKGHEDNVTKTAPVITLHMAAYFTHLHSPHGKGLLASLRQLAFSFKMLTLIWFNRYTKERCYQYSKALTTQSGGAKDMKKRLGVKRGGGVVVMKETGWLAAAWLWGVWWKRSVWKGR